MPRDTEKENPETGVITRVVRTPGAYKRIYAVVCTLMCGILTRHFVLQTEIRDQKSCPRANGLRNIRQ